MSKEMVKGNILHNMNKYFFLQTFCGYSKKDKTLNEDPFSNYTFQVMDTFDYVNDMKSMKLPRKKKNQMRAYFKIITSGENTFYDERDVNNW